MLKARSHNARALLRLAVLTCAALAVVPASALAAPNQVIRSGLNLTWTGSNPGGDSAQTSLVPGDPAITTDDQIQMYDANQMTIVSAIGCTPNTGTVNQITCPLNGVNRTEKVIFNANGGGPDNIYNFASFAGLNGLKVEMNGGAGPDFLYGGGTSNTSPAVMRGGSGQDTIYGSDGVDTLEGGDGSDFMIGFAGGDSFSGGAEFDQVAYYDRLTQTDKVDVTIDGVANDGSVALAEKDNVLLDVEDIIGGPADDHLVGSAASNTLDGGEGNDVLEGKEGFDSFLGGDGNDQVFSRDGRSERLDCGEGADIAIMDTSDGESSCETANRSDEFESDVDKDGVSKPADCNDKDPAIHPGATDTPNNGVDEDCNGADLTKIDNDGDGFAPPADCNDANKGQSPGVPEVYGNKVDEDCNGKADPLLAFTSRFLNAFKKRKGVFTVARLSILNPAPNSTVLVLCKGGKKLGCPFDSKSQTVPAGSRDFKLEKLFGKKVKLKPKAEIEVRMLRKDAIGRVSNFKFSKKKDLPTETKLCMAPTDPKPRKC